MSFSDADIHKTLLDHWGYESFRPAQLEIIRSVLAGKDTVGLLPTGGGKSITFQVPALMLPGLTVVVTPLISLMKDQVDNLSAHGIKAAYLHSGLTRRESSLAIDRCRLGVAKLLYLSPERLQSSTFVDRLRHFNVSLIVVDEAHCISQWGYDFRPSYLKIATLRKMFPDIPVLALTASATPEVLNDISEKLSMRVPDIYRLSFSRNNISYIVRYCDYKEGKAIDILRRVRGTAIVYVRSRIRTRQIAETLAKAGISAEYYHAGLLPEEKEERQNRWKSGETRVMVATNAFGMGIDKPDVRVVIHYDLPSSLEEYYQEAGRAGRDGLHSFAVILANKSDKTLLSRRLADSFPPKETIRRVYEMAGNFLDVPVGEGFNHIYEFNLNLFCSRFGFMPAVAHNALGILSQSGYIDYNEEISTRSRIMMLMTREDLYSLEVDGEPERVLQFILRNYTGIFTDYEIISEPLIASNLSYTPETVYQALLTLGRMHVLHYVPRTSSPFISYTTSREEPQHLIFPKSAYEDRRRRMEMRVEAMKRFVFDSEECRVNTMLRYFGETPSSPCGMCDVCRDRRKQSGEKRISLENSILYLASQPGGRSLEHIIANTGVHPDRVIDAIRSLADDGKLAIDGDNISIASD